MIVVEGPDGAGKTTLIRDIRQFFNIPVAPRVVSKGAEAMTDLKVWTENNVSLSFHKMIYDRHRLISEPIYGSVLRDYFEPGFGDPEWLWKMYRKFYTQANPLIIYCLPSWEVVEKNVANDTEDQPDHVRAKIRSIYAQYAAKAAVDAAVHERAVIYDYTQSPQFHSILRLVHVALSEEQIHV